MGRKPLTDWFRLMGNYGFSQLKREALVETALIGGWIRNYTNGVGWIDGSILASPRVEAAALAGSASRLSRASPFYFATRTWRRLSSDAACRRGIGKVHCHSRQARDSDTSAAPELPSSLGHVSKSFAERRFDAEPYSYDKTSYDHGDDSLEYIALCLLDSSAPAPQVLKIRAKVPAIIFVHSEGSQRRRDGFENHCIDIV
jgi:hypothetical protein